MLRRFSAAFLLTLATSSLAHAQTTPATAIRATAPFTLDGDDADWKSIPVSQTLGDAKYGARFKLAFTATDFWALFDVPDSSPLKNATPLADPAMMLKGGDAIGLTFGPAGGSGTEQRLLFAQLGGKPVAVVYRPKSELKKPYSFKSPVGTTTHEYVAALPEAGVAFKPIAGGYRAEIRVPFSVLGYAPQNNLEFPFDAQVIFSDAAGQLNAATAWWHSVGGGPLATVDLPTEARLYPELWGKARLLDRAPAAARPQRPQAPAGPPIGIPIRFTLPRAAKVSLNITDASGWILRELVSVQPRPAGASTVYWDGRDEYGDPLPPGDYRWKLIYFDGVSSKRIGGAGNSARPPFRTLDGKGDLGAVHGFPAAVAADGQGVYHLSGTEEGNPGLTKLSPDGFTLWKKSLGGYGNGVALATGEKFAAMIVSVGGKTVLVTLDPETGRDAPVVGKLARFELGDDKTAVSGFVILGGKAYYGLPQANRVAVLDLETGTKTDGFAVDSPRGLCRLDDKTILVVGGHRVLKLDGTTGATSELLTNLDDPHAIARDKNGNLLVSLWGKSQQVVQYSPAGKELFRFGKPGGRPATSIPYDTGALREVKSLALAPDGNLWFLEASQLRRACVFAPDGKWLRDVFQTLPSQAGAGVDLDDPVRVYFHTGYDSTVGQARIDFAANARDPYNPAAYWKMEAIYNMTATGDYTPPAADDVAAKSTEGSVYNPIAFTAKNGKRYLWQEGNAASLWIKQDGRLLPLHVIGGRNYADGTTFPKGKDFTWSDANGDGKATPNEIETPAEGSKYSNGTWRWIDADLKLYGNGGTLKPYKVDARGVPFYHLTDWKPDVTVGKSPSDYFRDGGYGIFPSPPAPDSSRYYVFNVGAGLQRGFWDRATYSRIAKVKDGKIQWIAGQHDGTKQRDGAATYLWRPLGEVDGTVIVGDVDFQLVAYTSDGFALGGIAPHPARELTPEAMVQENVQSGHFIKDPTTGKPLVIIGSGTEAYVLEVKGIDPKGISHLEGKVTLAASEPRSVQTPGQYSILYRTWPQRDNGRYFDVTGDGWGWRADVPWLEVNDGKTPVADVRLRRDAGALHIYASVLDASPFASTADPATFTKSDGVEVLLGPAEPRGRTAAAAGDVRFFLSGKPRANRLDEPWEGVLLAGFPGSGDTALKPVPGAKVAAREALNGHGYHVEASIPLSFLPRLTREREVTYIRNYQPGATRRGDFVETYTNVKPDMPDVTRLNVAIWQSDGKAVKRVAWTEDGQQGEAVNPAKWGLANALVSLQWPYVPGAKVNIYRGTSARLEDAKLIKTVEEADVIGDTPGLGVFNYWVEATLPGATPQLAGPQVLNMNSEANTEPILKFGQWRANPIYATDKVAAQKVFAGSTTLVDIASNAKNLKAVASSPDLQINAIKLDDTRWRLALKASDSLPATYNGTIKLTADGLAQAAEFPVSASAISLLGVLQNTNGQLSLDSKKLGAGQPVTALNWNGDGNLARREIGSRGYVLFRYGGYGAAMPVHSITAPFTDTFTGPDGFWYGEGNSNMRFDLDGKVGKDDKGVVRFGSVNSNAGTTAAGPGASWKIQVTDNKPHIVTIFTPAIGTNAAKERFTATAADGTTQTVEFDGTQGGAILQFGFVGNITLGVQQTVGGMGSSNPGANVAALFLD